ncbi:MAG: hypothetical protein HWD89_04350 [Tenacibaculum sp.]|uniref:hypothetical protein n=1 Tax=Tenacibaculum sp. TaxID=1906242 RepID=UPI00182466CC|nr:hypothetical protein [Tenacibaculum sp.]NVK08258.1 hypothetical protein [Tenacibaculum sp.]
MKQNKETLKQFFETGDKPTQQQYADLIDSYIDAKQPEGEANRRFVIDELGEVSVASEQQVSEYTLSPISGTNTVDLLKDGVSVSQIDLTPYLDNTNLARLVSGTVDANGLATFTRDDNSTFTVDLSNLKDTVPQYQAGTNISIDTTDPLNPILSSDAVTFADINSVLKLRTAAGDSNQVNLFNTVGDVLIAAWNNTSQLHLVGLGGIWVGSEESQLGDEITFNADSNHGIKMAFGDARKTTGDKGSGITFKKGYVTSNDFGLSVYNTDINNGGLNHLISKEVGDNTDVYINSGSDNNSTVNISGNVNITGSINSKEFKLEVLNSAPASATDVGEIGEIRYTAEYIYVCVANNTWKRTALSTW